jgi:tetratricopeptide (TPR) repeat protein
LADWCGKSRAAVRPISKPTNFAFAGVRWFSDLLVRPEAIREALELLRDALQLDSDYAEAHRWLAFCLWASWAHDAGENREPNATLSVEHARKAVALDPNDANNHWILGHVLAYQRQWADCENAFARSLELDPNNADALAMMTEIAAYRGDPVTGVSQAQRAFRLNPRPPPWYYWELGLGLYAARDYAGAIAALRNDSTYRSGSRRILAASLAQSNRLDEANREAKLFLAGNPRFTITHWAVTQPIRDLAVRDHFIEGYRKAGLPE